MPSEQPHVAEPDCPAADTLTLGRFFPRACLAIEHHCITAQVLEHLPAF